MTHQDVFAIHTEGPTMTIEVHGPVSSLANDSALRGLDGTLEQIRANAVRDVLVDFGQSPYVGSGMLEALRMIWNDVHSRGGRLVLCNVSPVCQEILHLAKFDQLWPVVATRQDGERQLQAMC
jgi:anti-anti-sigma regulatory factor